MSLTLAHRGTESRAPEAFVRDISSLVDQLAVRYPAIRSIWLTGHRADGGAPELPRPFDWELVAFADEPVLRSLRKATDLHRTDVLLRIVIDGDRLEVAWGKLHLSGSLFQWDWREATELAAYYSEARWSLPAGTGNVERVRRRAACLWRSKSRAGGMSAAPHRDAVRSAYR